MRSHYDENARGNRVLLQDLELLDRFKARGIPALPLKGPILAMSIYGDLAERQFNDLDIFVPADQMSVAKDVLIARGTTNQG